jgi:hypothetical protein
MIHNKTVFFLILTACVHVLPAVASQSPQKTVGGSQETPQQEEYHSGYEKAADFKSNYEQHKGKNRLNKLAAQQSAQASAALEESQQAQADEILAISATILSSNK